MFKPQAFILVDYWCNAVNVCPQKCCKLCKHLIQIVFVHTCVLTSRDAENTGSRAANELYHSISIISSSSAYKPVYEALELHFSQIFLLSFHPKRDLFVNANSYSTCDIWRKLCRALSFSAMMHGRELLMRCQAAASALMCMCLDVMFPSSTHCSSHTHLLIAFIYLPQRYTICSSP